jgi:hypothetical protein
MSLNSQIETAKDAVSKALITALENKNELVVSKLMTCYTNLNTISVTDTIPQTPFKIDLGRGGVFTNNYSSYSIPCSSMNDDVISFTGLG